LDLGPDRAPGGGDDQTIGLTPSYIDGSTEILFAPAAPIGEGVYHWTARSGDPGLHTADGIPLDGDGDGAGGDDFFLELTVDQTPPVVIDVSIQRPSITIDYHDLGGIDTASATDEANYTVGFDLLTSAGEYVVAADPTMVDMAGNLVDPAVTDTFDLLADEDGPFATRRCSRAIRRPFATKRSRCRSCRSSRSTRRHSL